MKTKIKWTDLKKELGLILAYENTFEDGIVRFYDVENMSALWHIWKNRDTKKIQGDIPLSKLCRITKDEFTGKWQAVQTTYNNFKKKNQKSNKINDYIEKLYNQ